MSTAKPITIVGGGLAGLTLGIGLRQGGVPVTVLEAGSYPRHRVCGEFISGKGQGTLTRLGLIDKISAAGAIPARTTAFFSPYKSSAARELAEPALSISRHSLDGLLADEFRKLGGELRENERWQENFFPEGVVRATGRRVQPMVNGWRWFGLKVHARNVPLATDLEMHLSSSGYVGMSRLKDGDVNICGLFRRRVDDAAGPPAKNWQDMLRGEAATIRHQRLSHAEFDEDSFCSVAGLSLRPRRAVASTECSIGDSITMIAPVTGNGMSMAFESAELALEPLADYSVGKIPWHAAQQEIARRCDAAFARRLAWSEFLQRMMFVPSIQNALVPFAPRWRWVWRMLLEKTR